MDQLKRKCSLNFCTADFILIIFCFGEREWHLFWGEPLKMHSTFLPDSRLFKTAISNTPDTIPWMDWFRWLTCSNTSARTASLVNCCKSWKYLTKYDRKVLLTLQIRFSKVLNWGIVTALYCVNVGDGGQVPFLHTATKVQECSTLFIIVRTSWRSGDSFLAASPSPWGMQYVVCTEVQRPSLCPLSPGIYLSSQTPTQQFHLSPWPAWYQAEPREFQGNT